MFKSISKSFNKHLPAFRSSNYSISFTTKKGNLTPFINSIQNNKILYQYVSRYNFVKPKPKKKLESDNSGSELSSASDTSDSSEGSDVSDLSSDTDDSGRKNENGSDSSSSGSDTDEDLKVKPTVTKQKSGTDTPAQSRRNETPQMSKGGESNQLNKVIIKNLNFNMGKEELIDYIYGKFGESKIMDVFLPSHRDTRFKNRGFAFVTFDSKETTDIAVNELNNLELFDRAITCSWVSPNQPENTGGNSTFKSGFNNNYNRDRSQGFQDGGSINTNGVVSSGVNTSGVNTSNINGSSYVNIHGLPGELNENSLRELINIDKLNGNINDIKCIVYNNMGHKFTNAMIGLNNINIIGNNNTGSAGVYEPRRNDTSNIPNKFSFNTQTNTTVDGGNNNFSFNKDNKSKPVSKVLQNIDHDKLAKEIDELLNTSSEDEDSEPNKDADKEESTKTVEGSSKPVQGSSKTVEGPSKTVEGPSKTVEGPSKTEEKPSKTEEKPSKTEEKPPKVAKKPRITEEKTTKVSKKPTKKVAVKEQSVKLADSRETKDDEGIEDELFNELFPNDKKEK